MGKINLGRVLLGGLVAGVILNAGEWLLNGVVLKSTMDAFFKKCGIPQPGNNFLVIAIAITFVLGIVIVLGYAAIRPRFGPGPKTAIIAALFAWFGVYLYQNVIGLGLQIVPVNAVAIALVMLLPASELLLPRISNSPDARLPPDLVIVLTTAPPSPITSTTVEAPLTCSAMSSALCEPTVTCRSALYGWKPD